MNFELYDSDSYEIDLRLKVTEKSVYISIGFMYKETVSFWFSNGNSI